VNVVLARWSGLQRRGDNELRRSFNNSQLSVEKQMRNRWCERAAKRRPKQHPVRSSTHMRTARPQHRRLPRSSEADLRWVVQSRGSSGAPLPIASRAKGALEVAVPHDFRLV
jgi:hypothetical protein